MSAWRSEWDAELVPVPDDSERAVEIPWAASAIGSCAGLWLDIGYAYAEPRFWEAIPNHGWRRRLRYGFGLDVAPAQHVNTLDMELVGDILDYDLSSLPRFNLITRVSTPEHLGCDNTNYLEGIARREGPFGLQKGVLAKLVKVLSRRRRLLVSVRFGAFQDHGWFLQYNQEMVGELVTTAKEAGGRLWAERYYALKAKGWHKRNPESLAGYGYSPDEYRATAVALLEFCRQAAPA